MKKIEQSKPPSETQDLIKANQTDENTIALNMCKNSSAQTGCDSYDGAEAVIFPGVNAVASSSKDTAEATKMANYYLSLMAEFKPRDPFEGLLITQMSLVHQQALKFLSMTNLNQNHSHPDILTAWSNRYIKLMKLFTQQMDALDRHRRGGKQTVSVEHVHVHQGGQAIVGNVSKGGGDEK